MCLNECKDDPVNLNAGFRLFFKRLLLLLPIPVLLVAVNYFNDPGNIFDEDYEAGIADYLSRGYNVTNVLNYNERVFQKMFIEKMNACPDQIVLGASRAMQLRNWQPSDGGCFINNAMSAAALEDYLAIYGLYEKKGCTIKKVIIAAEPWLFNENNKLVKWKALSQDYAQFCWNLNLDAAAEKENLLAEYEKYQQLFSFSYFRTSLRYFLKGIDRHYHPTTEAVNEGFTRLADGTITYDKAARDLSAAAIREKAENTLQEKSITYCGEYREFSRRYQQIFESFISYLQEKNIEPVFFLSPYHPTVYSYFKSHPQYHIIFRAESYYRSFAQCHGIQVWGSYDPAVYHLDNSCFLDGVHCNDKAREIIFGGVAAGYAARPQLRFSEKVAAGRIKDQLPDIN